MLQCDKRAAIYVRVSTDEQDVSMQLYDLRRYSEQRGFEIVEEFSDQASGAQERRPALDRLMDAARKRKFDILVVWRFDRFARSSKHLAMALDEFRVLGIQFISYNENIDTSTPMGQAMFTIISAMAQLERDVIRSRVKAGIRAAKAKGKVLGRRKTRNDAEIIRLHDKGLSYTEIGRRLGCERSAIYRALKAMAKTRSRAEFQVAEKLRHRKSSK